MRYSEHARRRHDRDLEREVDVPGMWQRDPVTGELMLDDKGQKKPVKLLFVLLEAEDEGRVIEKANAYAIEKKSPKIGRGDDNWDLAASAMILALAAKDIDSPEDAREPFFAGGWDEIMGRLPEVRGLMPDVIAFLREQQEAFQRSKSPYRWQMSWADVLLQAKREVAASDEAPFLQLEPSARWSYQHSITALLVTCPEAMSLLSSLITGSATLSELESAMPQSELDPKSKRSRTRTRTTGSKGSAPAPGSAPAE